MPGALVWQAPRMPFQRSPSAPGRLREARVSLLMPGIACVVAAVVGGGLEAAGMTLPVLDSPIRQVLLGVVGLGLIVLSLVEFDKQGAVPDQKPVQQDEGSAKSTTEVRDPIPVFKWKVTTRPDGTREDEMEFFDEALAKEHLIRRDSITWATDPQEKSVE